MTGGLFQGYTAWKVLDELLDGNMRLKRVDVYIDS